LSSDHQTCNIFRNGNNYVNAIFALTDIVTKRMFNPFIHSNFIFYLTPIGRKFKSHCEFVHQFDEKVRIFSVFWFYTVYIGNLVVNYFIKVRLYT